MQSGAVVFDKCIQNNSQPVNQLFIVHSGLQTVLLRPLTENFRSTSRKLMVGRTLRYDLYKL